MKKIRFILSFLLAIGVFAAVTTTLVGCDDDEPAALTLSALTADDIDLNGATSPSGVATAPTITATFSTALDASTVTADNIKIVRDYDDVQLPVTVSSSGNVVTITPNATMGTGSLHVLTFGTGLKSTGGKFLTEAVERNFTTAGTFAPAGVIAHFTFEDNANDVVGSFDPAATDVIALTFETSRNAAAGKAGSFNGTTTLVEIPNGNQLMASNSFSVAFWVKASTTKKSHFVFGLGGSKGFQFEIDGAEWTALNKAVKLATQYGLANGTTDGEDTWWNGDGKTKDNGGWQGSTFNKDLSSVGLGSLFGDKWAHVVCSFNASTKVGSMYVNGEKAREFDFNLWPADAPKKNVTGVKYAGNAAPGNKLALGFIQARENRILLDTWADYSNPDNNHFKGALDDLRIFSVPLSPSEVTLMYNSEKP
jgi:hypothetical protein